MSAEEFVIWMRGFVAGSHHFNLTPEGWDRLKLELSKVDLNSDNETWDGDDSLLD